MTIRARNEDGGEGGARVVTQTSIAAAFAAGDGGAADLDRERWLFLTPHDDDVVLGAGMLLEEATRTGIRTTVCVVTDGRMGYCRPEQRDDIIAIRRAETERAMELLGGPAIRRLDYPDCDLPNHAGRRRVAGGAEGISDGASTGAAVDYPDPRGGHTGLQNSFTALLRDLRPTRVFVPTGADYHPDHQIVHRELLISLFHATGAIWPELGAPLPAPPQLYETAIYCDFPAPPTLQIQGSPEAFERKLGAVIAFASQEQIAAIVDGVHSAGPFEYVRAVPFSLYDSRRYAKLFGGDGAT